MTDDQFLLANAYLDGELTADERARAEADPEVMAEVDELRALQDLVRDVDPPSPATRDAAIAAAMAEFTARSATAPAAARAPATAGSTVAPIPFRRRPAYAKYLAVAAGVLAVGVFGVAVANLGVGGDDDSADEATADVADESSEATMSATAEMRTADEAESEIAAAEVAPSDDAADAAGTAEESMDATMEASDEETDSTEAPADATTATSAGAPTGIDPAMVITTPEELGEYAALLRRARDDGTLDEPPSHDCPPEAGDVLGVAVYRDPVDPDADDVPVLVSIRDDAALALALRADGRDACDVIVEAILPTP